MIPTSTVRVCTGKELSRQAGLSSLLKVFVEPSASDVVTDRDRIVVLNLIQGGEALMEVILKENRIASLGPILSVRELADEERCLIWQAGVDWMTRQSPLALQLFGDPSTHDKEILANMGFPVTTDIVTLEWDGLGVTESLDGAIRKASYEWEQPALIRIATQTLVDSLDVPESISLHRPEDLLSEWVRETSLRESVILVAERRNEIVGLLVAGLGHSTSKGTLSYEIHYLGVAVEHRRQGWGSRLLRQFLQLAQAAGVPKVSVFTDQRNVPAIQLYQRFGFREIEGLRMPIVFHRLPVRP